MKPIPKNTKAWENGKKLLNALCFNPSQNTVKIAVENLLEGKSKVSINKIADVLEENGWRTFELYTTLLKMGYNVQLHGHKFYVVR